MFYVYVLTIIISLITWKNSKFKINLIIDCLRIITTIIIAYISTDNISKYIKLYWLELITYSIYFQKNNYVSIVYKYELY